MISRKIYAAFLTSVIGFFIVPFFFYEFSGGYDLAAGFAVSLFTVPTLFIGGVLSSIAIEYHNKNQSIWFSYLKHLGCSFLCILLFSILSLDIILTGIIAFLYVTIFFIIDLITKYRVVKGEN
ncbi:hypothetical protein [Lederbergia citrea]|uniref:Uncharacterized protein n=1 Tax=Lederbergia citrea TaxID=2833581 RepID=A0A942URU7_9BACI|nr:hypothetical protein [Lederbergia citrea]MBS4221814.1 hypothetical protein [Lederbergia citrea]